jgi:hypothetical protein
MKGRPRFDAISVLMFLVVLIAIGAAAAVVIIGIEVARDPRAIMRGIGELGRALVEGFKAAP